MISTTMSIDVIRCQHAVSMAASAPSRWLHPLELARCQELRSPSRRQQWLASRWWMKHLLLKRWQLGIAPSELLIVSHDRRNRGTAPQAYAAGERLPLAISLSHCDDYVAVAIRAGQPGSCGIDVVDADMPNAAALRTWITHDELPDAGDENTSHYANLWAAKEAAFKTLTGEPFRPGRIILRPNTSSLWQWTYRQADNVVTGHVELQKHSRFILAIARRHTPC